VPVLVTVAVLLAVGGHPHGSCGARVATGYDNHNLTPKPRRWPNVLGHSARLNWRPEPFSGSGSTTVLCSTASAGGERVNAQHGGTIPIDRNFVHMCDANDEEVSTERR
jgi:hypothetical protein